MQPTSIIMAICLAAFQGPAPATGPGGAPPAYPAAARASYPSVSHWTLRPIDKVIVPAQEQGILKDLNTTVRDPASGQPTTVRVTRGLYVAKDQVLGHIDDALATADLQAAQKKLDVANLEATNRINYDYATMACNVAKVIWEHDVATNKEVPGAVPDHEVMQHRLEYQKLGLQILQADHELKIAAMSVAVRQAELDKAKKLLDRMTIKAPIEGLVVNVFPHPGEWVQPGERVVEILRLDKLYVNGQQNSDEINPWDLVDRPVTITVRSKAHDPRYRDPKTGKPIEFAGRVIFASPEVMQGDDYTVEIEVQNKKDKPGPDGKWLLLPGWNVEVKF